MATSKTAPQRNYTVADAIMLTTCATIAKNATVNKAFLISKRPGFKDPFFANLEKRIDDAIKKILGIDNAKEQREATTKLLELSTVIEPLLGEFKIQVEVDFEDNKREKEILKQLGFAHYAKVIKGNQMALLELLAKFKENMSPQLQAEITDAGTDETYITQLSGYAATVAKLNVNQESLKKIKKTIVASGIEEMNAIYKQTIGVAQIAAKFFAADAAKAELFSFSKISAAISNKSTAAEKSVVNPSPK